VQPTLIIQELQTIKLKQQTSITLIKLDSLSYLCDDCHKQAVLISESRDDLNRCTPCRGKPDQHATCFPHSVHVWPSTIRISRGPRIATFHIAVNIFEQIHCPPSRRAPDTIHNTMADRSAGPYPTSLSQ
jgi:hypothetical protein